MLRVNKRTITKILFLTLVCISFITSNSDEEMCPLTKHNNKQGCGSEIKIEPANDEDLFHVHNEQTKSMKEEDQELLKKQLEHGNQERAQVPNTDTQKVVEEDDEFRISDDVSSLNESDELVYQELFEAKGDEEELIKNDLKDGKNFTEIFDFSLIEEEVQAVRTDRIVFFPDQRFKNTLQGNFLHFYRVAYEKKLPVFFTTDSYLYALNENVQKIMQTFYEEVYLNIFKKFLEDFYKYVNNEKETETDTLSQKYLMLERVEIYLATGLAIMHKNLHEYKYPEHIFHNLEVNVALIEKYAANTFSIMGKMKKLDTSLMFPRGFWRYSKRLASLYKCLSWFRIIKFDIEKDIKEIWFLSYALKKAGLVDIYEKLFKMQEYFVGQEFVAPTFFKFINLSDKLDIDDYFLTDEHIAKILDEIDKHKIEDQIPILGEYLFFDEDSLKLFRYNREFTTGLINNPGSIDDWVKNKLIDPRRGMDRYLMSYAEFIYILTGNPSLKPLIEKRMKGEKSYENDILIPFRDKVDFKEVMEESRKIIKRAYKFYEQNFRNNLLNHLILLSNKATRRITGDEKDPVYRNPVYTYKNFLTSFGSYAEFNRELVILQSNINSNPSEEGDIPDVIIEENPDLFVEVKFFIDSFNDHLEEAIKNGEDYLRVKFSFVRSFFQRKFKALNFSIKGILTALTAQMNGTMTDEVKATLRKLYYYDQESGTHLGWYTDLFQTGLEDDKNQIFAFKSFVNRVHVVPPINHLQFGGAILFTAIKYPKIGLIIVENEGKKKLLLFSSYNAEEFLKKYSQKVSFTDISESIQARNKLF